MRHPCLHRHPVPRRGRIDRRRFIDMAISCDKSLSVLLLESSSDSWVVVDFFAETVLHERMSSDADVELLL
ncbi:hypothetical protein AMC81_PE00377 (plasmid) [Rhizobium phaseoli]|uniref:Uncharacterized protein n=1 Tax=Rhizobium phaseoli TaxID=396 RepID=A0ABN4QW76_9HYPH|nr:hypothetical protein AMC85_PD00465 [Rhizobium phaseoli]ANL88623.1 hypothetical protein AMC81_PE00377 [Rhizobium phaseoli]ANL95132.1 hypothetical protein AMC80_PE00377 [Rhizobium phaseoli]